MTLTEAMGPFPRTIPQALQNGMRWADKECIDFTGESYTYAEVYKMTMRYAHGLEAIGVRQGDRVSYMLDNSSDAFFLWLSISVLGAVAVPVNTAFRGEFLRHHLADADPSVFVVEHHYLDRFAEIEDSLPMVGKLICRGEFTATTQLDPIPFHSICTDDDSAIERDIQQSDLAMLLYTSGTTGPSKGCMISHGYLCNMAAIVVYMTGAREGDKLWTPLPMTHGGAYNMMLGCMLLGMSVSLSTFFSLSNFWPEIERSGATAVMVVSKMIPLIADAPDTDVSKRCYGQLRIVSGNPFPHVYSEKWKRRFGVQLCGAPGFGMTEVCPPTAWDMSISTPPPNTSGRRYELFDVEIVNDEGEICPPGVAGEIIVRPLQPDIMFQGYWRRTEDTNRLIRNGWFYTGDIGRFDEDGWFYWLDRKKDYLRRGGENISSFEMEVTFRAHPAIEEVAVHAVKSELAEDDVKVTAILVDGAILSEEELCRWSLDQVPFYAVPRYVEFRKDMPRTQATNRIQKYKLREEGVTPTTWDREKSEIVVPKRKTTVQSTKAV